MLLRNKRPKQQMLWVLRLLAGNYITVCVPFKMQIFLVLKHTSAAFQEDSSRRSIRASIETVRKRADFKRAILGGWRKTPALKSRKFSPDTSRSLNPVYV